jgi:pimeloyl-ACP methyl ester carboxylesterase
MNIKIKDININYVQYGQGKDILLLHGWGQNIIMMDAIGKALAKDFKITILDLPGFGESDMPNKPLTIYDYYEILNEFTSKLKIKKPIIIGHSFGGRIALIYASIKPVTKLILFGTPFKKRITKISLKLRIFKILKQIPILNKLEDISKKFIGSRDYRNANPIMRKILVNIVNEDLTENAKKITCPTIIINGDLDNEVLVEEAKELESLISDAGLIIYPGLSHYAYLENIYQTIKILNEFLKDNKNNN